MAEPSGPAPPPRSARAAWILLAAWALWLVVLALLGLPEWGKPRPADRRSIPEPVEARP